MGKVSIYVATHKKAKRVKHSCYVPICVGATNREDTFGYITDDTGVNISAKNPNFCELTALYWMWKNAQSDIIGLVHYRRYFYNSIFSYRADRVLSEKDIKRLLKRNDLIVPLPYQVRYTTIKNHYAKHHNVEDYLKCGEIIKNLYPDYYDSYKVISNQKQLYSYNMLICRKELFDQYMEWMFSILFKLEKEIDISSYDAYGKRVFGFLSERLFNIWLHKNSDLRIVERPVYNIEGDFQKQRTEFRESYENRI